MPKEAAMIANQIVLSQQADKPPAKNKADFAEVIHANRIRSFPGRGRQPLH